MADCEFTSQHNGLNLQENNWLLNIPPYYVEYYEKGIHKLHNLFDDNDRNFMFDNDIDQSKLVLQVIRVTSVIIQIQLYIYLIIREKCWEFEEGMKFQLATHLTWKLKEKHKLFEAYILSRPDFQFETFQFAARVVDYSSHDTSNSASLLQHINNIQSNFVFIEKSLLRLQKQQQKLQNEQKNVNHKNLTKFTKKEDNNKIVVNKNTLNNKKCILSKQKFICILVTGALFIISIIMYFWINMTR